MPSSSHPDPGPLQESQKGLGRQLHASKHPKLGSLIFWLVGTAAWLPILCEKQKMAASLHIWTGQNEN